MSLLHILGSESEKLHHLLLTGDNVRLVTSEMSGLAKCLNSVDLFGRALAIDNAYRHMTSAEQYLLDAQKMQDSAPHTDVTDSSLNAIDRAKDWLRPYSVSPDNASCRDPPVCVVSPPTSFRGIDANTAMLAGTISPPTGLINFI